MESQSDIKDLTEKIKQLYPEMSKGQKAISDYIINNYERAAFMTAAKLGSIVNVSESTISRYAVLLGYEGYPELQKAFQGVIKNKLTTLQRMEIAAGSDNADILKNVLKSDISNIKATMESIDHETFTRVVNEICRAKRIFLLGLRSAAITVEFMGYYLGFMLDNVNVVTSGVNDILERLSRIREGDLLVTISFPRYARRAVDGTEYAKSRGAKTIVLTDSEFSPLVPFADEVLYARSDMASFVDSLVAPLSVVNALLIAVGLNKSGDIKNNFASLEEIWNRYGVYTERDSAIK